MGYLDRRPQGVRAQAGFTLIELIIVILVMGILSFGTVQFILNTADAYSDTARRDRMGSTGRAAIEKMSRELRNALPNSVRAAGGCIEFVPVLAGSTYVSIPTVAASTAASTGFSSVPFSATINDNLEVGQVAVYPIASTAIYTLSTDSIVSPLVTTASSALAPNPASGAITVTLTSAHRFLQESPSKRWFMVDTPVSFCLEGARIYRYDSYGFSRTQPASSGLPSTVASGRRLLATQASTDATAFTLLPATLQRNAIVQFDLNFEEQVPGEGRTEGIRISHEVQLRNVP